MSSRTILVNTDANGDFAYERPCFSCVIGVLLDVDDLGAPDVVVEDANQPITFASWTGQATDAVTNPFGFCSGDIRITVANAAPNAHGQIRLLLWG